MAELAADGRCRNLVVDPVWCRRRGRLLDPGAEAAYLDALFPHAGDRPTPGRRRRCWAAPRTVDEAREAAASWGGCGPQWVVVKGGHQAEAPGGDASAGAVDAVFEAATGEITELRRPRVATPNDHGTGCTFGAATAAGLARGQPVPEALAGAKRFVHEGPGVLRRVAARRRPRAGRQAGALGAGRLPSASRGRLRKLGAWRRPPGPRRAAGGSASRRFGAARR